MKIIHKILISGLLLAASCTTTHVAKIESQKPITPIPINFIYTRSDIDINKYLKREDIAGLQVVYDWKDLEVEKDRYDFGKIEKDLAITNTHGKKLFIQIQDRFFQPEDKNVPYYLMKEPPFKGGIVPQFDNPGENKPITMGWVTEQWNPDVRLRFQKLLQALAARFDGKIYGINLPETAIDIDMKRDKTGFSCDAYFAGEMENLKVAKEAFKKSVVVQYVNFWPCEWANDRRYMERIFDYASKNNIGLGGPDIVPYKKAQMKNSYAFFNKYKNKLALAALAVQEATLTYTNPDTKKPFSKEEFQTFASDYLGANIIFWSTESSWLTGK